MDKPVTLSRKQLGGLVLGGIAVAATTSTALAQAATATPVPTNGDDAFDILMNDHKRLKMHIERLISDVPARRETLSALSFLFAVHNATEENYIYPAVAKIAMLPHDAEELFHQQDGGKEVVWTLHAIGKNEGFASPKFTTTSEILLHAALAHVHMEETQDFPKLRAALGPQQLAELTHEVREFRKRFS